MSYTVEAITNSLALGEGPHWDVETQTLYFIDMIGCSIHSYKPATNKHSSVIVGKDYSRASFIIPIEKQKDKFLISYNKNEIATIKWDGENSEVGTPQIIARFGLKDEFRLLNDGKADAKGRLWAGTCGPPTKDREKMLEPEVGALYTLIDGKEVKKQLEKITASNGMTWSLDNKKFYYIDTMKFRVDSYDYDIEKCSISNEKTIFDFKKNNIPGMPDGMTIDSEGKLYVASFGAGQVLRIDPETGSLISNILIPVPQVTSVTFGGPNLDELYVTTANFDIETLQAETAPKEPNAGCVFKVANLGVKGLPAMKAVIKS